MPFWKLTSKLEILSIDFCSFVWETNIRVMGEQLEEPLASFELPAALPADYDARLPLQKSMACRMVFAAARAGLLKSIIYSMALQVPYAVRTLLPCWVNLACTELQSESKWDSAAQSFRPLLAHASLWLGTTKQSGAREDRRLTLQEVQGLQSYFEKEGMHSYAHVKD